MKSALAGGSNNRRLTIERTVPAAGSAAMCGGQAGKQSSQLASTAPGIEKRPRGAGGFKILDSVERVTIRHRNQLIGVGTALGASNGDR
jgi:hypothetical protein